MVQNLIEFMYRYCVALLAVKNEELKRQSCYNAYYEETQIEKQL